MNKLRFGMLTLCVTAALPGLTGSVAHAGSTSWSCPNYSCGSYVPLTGGFQEYMSSGDYVSHTYFKLDANNVAKIKDYNDGGVQPGGWCTNTAAFLTLDQTAVPNSWDLEISAWMVSTNLPNPKIDLEDNSYFADFDESEVVALGVVSVNAWSYYMATWWHDYRDGDAGDGGKIQAQFAMSNKGFSDYNNCVQSGSPQIINSYGNTLGSL